MTVHKTDEHRMMTERYYFDCGECAAWAQLDTDQDAPYYGGWANPETFQILTFAEGDITRIKCDTPEEFTAELRSLIDWNKEATHWIGIDTWPNVKMAAQFAALGFQGELH